MNEDPIQFKLANGEEILCEVLDWDMDDQFASILIWHAFKLLTIEDTNIGMRYYTLRPWMTYMDDPDKHMLLSSSMIVGQSRPSGKLLEQFIHTLQAHKEPSEPEDKNTNEIINILQARMQNARDSSYEVFTTSDQIH